MPWVVENTLHQILESEVGLRGCLVIIVAFLNVRLGLSTKHDVYIYFFSSLFEYDSALYSHHKRELDPCVGDSPDSTDVYGSISYTRIQNLTGQLRWRLIF